MRRLAVAVAAGALGLAVGLILPSPTAGAHAVLESSDPADGTQLDAPPEILITFTEPPELSLSSVQVLDPTGTAYETGELAIFEGDDHTLVVPIEPLPDDAYTVSWRVVSAADGHTTAGAFSFGVGVPAAPAGDSAVDAEETPSLSLLETAGRFTLFAGLAGLVGVAVVVLVAFGTLSLAQRWLLIGSWMVAVAGFLLLAIAQERAAASGFSALLDTNIGRALVWRAVALAAAGLGVAVALATTGGRQYAGLGVAGLAAAGAVAAHVAAGHAAVAPWPGLDVASQWVHVVAIGVWIGGLGTLLIGLPSLSRSERGTAARRFSMLAAVALAAVVATGTWRAISELPDWGPLFSSGYGLGIVAKITGLAVLAGLGAVNRYRNIPAASNSPAGLRQLGRVELSAAVVVLGAAAVVASLSPPSPTVVAAEESERVVVSGNDTATSVRAELTVDPGTAGSNQFSLQLADFDTDEAIEGADVVLRFSYLDDVGIGESELVLEETSTGAYGGPGANLSLEGRWRVTAVVQRGVASVEVPLELETASGADVRTIETPGGTTYEVDLPSGGTVQVLPDPEQAGQSQLHVFFYDAEGFALPVEAVEVMARAPEDDKIELTYQPFTPGHGIVDVVLTVGEWEFELTASDPEGTPVSARIPIPIDG